jgi:pantoate--beta-alanine ligase
VAAVVLKSAQLVRAECDRARSLGQSVGFVPTMGALHAGHLSLVAEAQRRAPFVVVSIFVNPTQFGPGEDFDRYPRDLDRDVRLLGAHGNVTVFAPELATLYPPGNETRLRMGALAERLCGPLRPGHFDGVATVVAKLFNVVGPCRAVFGRKDYQQLLVIRRMAADLFAPVEVIGHPIVRESDGLAMSSRNQYLSAGERSRALAIVRGLRAATASFAEGERSARKLERLARQPIEQAGARIDYVEACDPDNLDPLGDVVPERALLAVACHVGKTRLIDNVVLGEDAPLLLAEDEAPGVSASR